MKELLNRLIAALRNVGNLRKILYTVPQSGETDDLGDLDGRLYSFFFGIERSVQEEARLSGQEN